VTGAEREYPVLNGPPPPDRDLVAWLASRHPLELIHFPPSPKKFLHSFLGCLKSSRSRFKSFYFFRKKLGSFEGFDQVSAFWSMFWFKPFRNFLRKIAIFRNFDYWSEILSMSADRPISQGVCPPLTVDTSRCIKGLHSVDSSRTLILKAKIEGVRYQISEVSSGVAGIPAECCWLLYCCCHLM
jgi:hypothetical protein